MSERARAFRMAAVVILIAAPLAGRTSGDGGIVDDVAAAPSGPHVGGDRPFDAGHGAWPGATVEPTSDAVCNPRVKVCED